MRFGEKYTGENGIGHAVDYINQLPFPVLDLGERESQNDRIKPADALASSCRLIGDQSRLRILLRAAAQDNAEKEWEEIRTTRQTTGHARAAFASGSPARTKSRGRHTGISHHFGTRSFCAW